MIKLIREGTRKYPWALKIIMSLLAVTFMIGMGWFGYETSQQTTIVAVVGPHEVEAQEYRRVYNDVYDNSREELEDEEVTKEDLKQSAIQTVVGRKLWLVAADSFAVDVHANAVRRAIMGREEFVQDGLFDPRFYHRFLAQNRVIPKQFEDRLARSMRIQKIQIIMQDVATLNQEEMEEVEAIAARQTIDAEDEADIEEIKALARLQILSQKQRLALLAFQNALARTIPVEIRGEFL